MASKVPTPTNFQKLLTFTFLLLALFCSVHLHLHHFPFSQFQIPKSSMDSTNPENNNNNRRTSNSHISMSDSESTASQVDSFHSPLRSESPLRSDDPAFQPENHNSKAIVAVDKYYSPVPSPAKSNIPASSPATAGVKGWRAWPQSMKPNSNSENNVNVQKPNSVVLGINRMVRDERQPPDVKKVVEKVEEGRYGGGGDEVGGERRSRAAVASILRRSERSVVVRKVALGFRVFEVVACLVSFSVMAADKTEGWSGDSFDRYREYRYCLAVNVIGFVYAGFQAFDLAYHLGTGKQVISHHLRYHFDFALDQILAYLLMSASSSAATRVDDWISNWGTDEFTTMASASIAMSFLAFIAFALSSLISGYNFCNRDLT